MKYLLDTNVVSEPALEAPNARLVARLRREAAVCAIPAPAWHELKYGVARLPRGRRRTALEAYLVDVVHASFPILPYDEIAAAWHGAERARMEKRGQNPPFVDGQIAAIAFVNSLELVTANLKDFRRFTGLAVTSWR